MDRKQFFETYIRTYIERDIRKIINVQDKIKFFKFISNVAVRTGQKLNMTDICNGIAITNVTGEKWISILTNTGLACYLAGYLNAKTLEKSAYNDAILNIRYN